MDVIILQDGFYQLYQVAEFLPDCFDLCDILREKLTTYKDAINKNVLKDGSFFFGCMCF